MSDFETRLAAVEAALAANQLPATLAILQRKLEQTWQPDAALLLQPGSVTPEMLSVAVPSLTSGALKISELRTTTATMATGTNAFALDLTGITGPGVLVVSMAPATHHTWTWYPHVGLGGLLFVNSGVSQSVTVKYYVVGS